jgi:hypothetical protein
MILMNNPCNLCQFFEKRTAVEKNQEAKTEIRLADICGMKGRTPFTNGKITAACRIAGYCRLRKMHIGEDSMGKELCKDRATIQLDK